MTDLLSIGSSAIAAYRSALATTGSNVANAQSPGYVRRHSDLRELPLGSGSAAVGVVRAWDGFAVDRHRSATSAEAQAGTGSRWLGRIETALGPIGGGIGAALSGFFASATRLSADPQSTVLRAAFVDGLRHVAASFNGTAGEIAAIDTALADESAATIDSINGTLAQLARVNDGLRQATPGSESQATLEDERDRLIDGLSGRMAVEVKYSESGAVRLSTPDSPDLPLLDRDGAAQLAYTDGTLYLSHPTGTRALSASGGALAGLDQARAALARRSADLDALAADFATAINAWSASGTVPSGAPGAAILAGSSAAALTVSLGGPDDIAAAGSGTANGNLLDLEALRTSARFEQRWDDIVSTNASMLARLQSDSEAATAQREVTETARAALSAVDLDAEAADLVALQQAYGAAARIIQTAREAFDAFLNRV